MTEPTHSELEAELRSALAKVADAVPVTRSVPMAERAPSRQWLWLAAAAAVLAVVGVGSFVTTRGDAPTEQLEATDGGLALETEPVPTPPGLFEGGTIVAVRDDLVLVRLGEDGSEVKQIVDLRSEVEDLVDVESVQVIQSQPATLLGVRTVDSGDTNCNAQALLARDDGHVTMIGEGITPAMDPQGDIAAVGLIEPQNGICRVVGLRLFNFQFNSSTDVALPPVPDSGPHEWNLDWTDDGRYIVVSHARTIRRINVEAHREDSTVVPVVSELISTGLHNVVALDEANFVGFFGCCVDPMALARLSLVGHEVEALAGLAAPIESIQQAGDDLIMVDAAGTLSRYSDSEGLTVVGQGYLAADAWVSQDQYEADIDETRVRAETTPSINLSLTTLNELLEIVDEYLTIGAVTTDPAVREQSDAYQLAISECMVAAGHTYEYEPPEGNHVSADEANFAGLGESEFVATNGFGFLVALTDPFANPEFGAALANCVPDESDAPPPSSLEETIAALSQAWFDEVQQAVSTEASVLVTEQHWSSCMAANGYSFTSRKEMGAEVFDAIDTALRGVEPSALPNDPDALLEFETAVATSDLDCRRETGLDAAIDSAMESRKLDFVGTHLDELYNLDSLLFEAGF